jgi:uncharacterized protein YndB with AHSA1/START domain
MNKELKATATISINASAADVWDALTNAEKIKVYLYGTDTITDWKEGSPISFEGEYEGQTYKDKGNVLKNEAKKVLQYNYWSGFSGLEDKLENYSIITYILEVVSPNAVKFTWSQQGFASEEGQQHSQSGLPEMLKQIKQLVEKA